MLPAGIRCPASAAASVSFRSVRSKPCMERLCHVFEYYARWPVTIAIFFSSLLAVLSGLALDEGSYGLVNAPFWCGVLYYLGHRLGA